MHLRSNIEGRSAVVQDNKPDTKNGLTVEETRVSRSGRGQTTLDFTLGVTVFIIVIAVVFLFVPGALEPFSEGGQEDIVTVNRVADDLSRQSLAVEETPHILNDTCTAAFFNESLTDCGYDGSIQDHVGIASFRQANVTVLGDIPGGSGTAEVLCFDPTADPGNRLSTPSCSGDATRLTAGNESAVTGSSVTARRVVELDGRDVFLVVKIW